MAILLNDILKIDDLKKIKVRLNMKDKFGYDPVKLFKEDKAKLLQGQFWNYKKKKSFQKNDIALGFAHLGNDKWLLFDISVITKDLNRLNDVGYEYETLKEYEKYFGRLIIEYHNTSQNLVRKADSIFEECKIRQLLEDEYDNDIFPGYENVNLTWEDLKRIINKEAWKTALENQKGIYLISDLENHKMYVGSASGKNMLLGRWQDYVKNGHGGNKKLKDLEFNYIKKNFRYTILEIYKSTIDDKIILDRENWWKEILQTKKFGYNEN